MIIPLIFLYILPTILSVIVVYSKEEQITRGDLIQIVMIALIPGLNLFIGYLGGLIILSQSKTINDFLDKRIK